MNGALNKLADELHEVVNSKGFWDEGKAKSFLEQMALVHSEVSEAVEEFRDGRSPDTIYYSGKYASGHPGESAIEVRGLFEKPEGIPIELADIIIRVLDTCAAYGIDIEEAIRAKMEYNAGRAKMHGKVC